MKRTEARKGPLPLLFLGLHESKSVTAGLMHQSAYRQTVNLSEWNQ